MASVPPAVRVAQPTNFAPLPGLFGYVQGLRLERYLDRAKRGVPTLALALVWLTLSGAGCATAARSAWAACPWDARLRLFAIGARTPTDARGPWVYVTSRRSLGPRALARTDRRRWRAEQAVEELVNGTDLDHLVSGRLHPNRVAIGFRLLARNLAIGRQIALACGDPIPIREPAAFRVEHVDGLATFTSHRRTIRVRMRRAPIHGPIRLPWSRLVVRHAA